MNGQRFCVCPSGLSGPTCAKCANLTCYNGGSCISPLNTEPYCVCDINFEGRFCERNKNPCLSNPCEFGSCEILTSRDVVAPSDSDMAAYYKIVNNYRMMNNDNISSSTQKFQDESEERKEDWRCRCYPGYTGVKCDHNVNECNSNPCLQGQECIDGVNDYQCTCGSCVFGLCVLETDGVNCRCFPGFAGTNCTQNINECKDNPCVHGDCVDFINGYGCTCYENYEGRTCNISLNENAEQHNETGTCTKSRRTCEHGLCVGQEPGAVCECYMGFTGKRCNVPTTFLASENTTFLSQHHRCFGREDLVEVCHCVSSICVSNETELHNTTVCNTLPFLYSLKRFCSAENVSSLCVSVVDINTIPIVQFICDRKQKMIQIPPDSAHVTYLVPTREKTPTHYFHTYILRCTFQNTKNTVNIELREEEIPLVTALPLYLHPPCYINDNANLLASNCSLAKLSLLFNLTRIPDYFQSVCFEITILNDSKSEVLNTWINSNTQIRTYSLLIKETFLLFDNDTQLLESDNVGQVTYTCDRRCDDSFCRQKMCESKSVYESMEYESGTYYSNDNRNSFCRCSVDETENRCNTTHGILKTFIYMYTIMACNCFPTVPETFYYGCFGAFTPPTQVQHLFNFLHQCILHVYTNISGHTKSLKKNNLYLFLKPKLNYMDRKIILASSIFRSPWGHLE